jgi:DNA-binding NtrC family response regulator
VRVGSSIAAAEQQLIAATMRLCDDDKQRAAKVLGISLKTLYCRLNMYAAVALK